MLEAAQWKTQETTEE